MMTEWFRRARTWGRSDVRVSVRCARALAWTLILQMTILAAAAVSGLSEPLSRVALVLDVVLALAYLALDRLDG